jgi:RNA polymerase sigma-70 factor (ECF subfamily)
VNPNPAIDLDDLRLLQQGHDLALERLIARWERPLYAFAWRYLQNAADAHDVVAEAFVRLYQQRLRLRPDTNLPAWLFTTVGNLCHNHHRWRRRHPSVSLDHGGEERAAIKSEGPELATVALAPDAALDHDEALAALAAAIDRLPHDLKTAVLLHHYEQLSYRDIGEVAGCSARGVETRLYRARQQLRRELAAVLRETVES